MSFNLNTLKNEHKKNENAAVASVQAFIDEFEDAIQSEEFEDWLQEELSRTSRLGEMYFSIGTGYESGSRSRHKFIVFGQYSFKPVIALVLPEYITFGRPDDRDRHKYPEYVKKYNDYTDAMDTCYKNLVTRLKGLGLKVVSNHPNFTVDYRDVIFKVRIEIDDEN